jgi:hypothetical protein
LTKLSEQFPHRKGLYELHAAFPERQRHGDMTDLEHQLGELEFMDAAGYAADAIQALIMKQDRYAVRSELDIAFEVLGPGRERGANSSAVFSG